jgi:hypothetical protein
MLSSSPDVIRMINTRRMKRVGHEPSMKGMRNEYKALGRRSEGKRPLGSSRYEIN